ncbi:MAG: SPFH domain-containing protein [Candidatus Helarchaeota archaeon]
MTADGGFIAIIITTIIIGAIIGIITFAIWVNNIVIVPPNEAHVVVSKSKKRIYDGQGRYFYVRMFNRRIIIPKEVIDVDIPDIRLHDMDNLPLVVRISCKVQIKNPAKAAETLGSDVYETLRRIVDDTVQSSARTICMQKPILTIMRERETIEEGIYKSLTGSFVKLGLEPIIFDIKDIRDDKDSSVIRDLERVKSAELDRNARIAEAQNNSEAKEVEIEKEKFITTQSEELVRKKMLVKELETRREAEIESQKELVLANAKAEAKRIEAEAEAEAQKLKAEAEAAGIREKAKALEEYNKAGEQGLKMKALEMLIQGMIESSKEVANALKMNSKVIIMGNGGSKSNSLMNLIPMAEILKESDIIKDLIKEFKIANEN